MNINKLNETKKQIVRVREGYSAIALLSTMLATTDPSDAELVADLIADAIEAGYDRALRQYAGSYIPAKFRNAGDNRS